MGNSLRNIVIAILTLWSVISLIVIVVWAATPQMKDVQQCQATVQKLEGDKGRLQKDRVELERMVLQGRENQTQLHAQIRNLLRTQWNITESLNASLQEIVILNENITLLGKEIDVHKEVQANLTAEISQCQEHIEVLQKNLTDASDEVECFRAKKEAAEKRKLAAETGTKDCESSKLLLKDKLQKCAKDTPTFSEQEAGNGSAMPKSSILALAVVLCTSLHLIT